MELITLDVLVSEIAIATKKSFIELFENKESYYYCTLITTGEGTSPFVSAWSWEALKRESEKLENLEDAEIIKWSYADSPYMCYGEEHFRKVDKLFDNLPIISDLDDKEWQEQYDFRLMAMELAMKRVDLENIFALNQPRKDVYINVEVMPPDYTNTERALRLNKAKDIAEWLEEAAE